MKLKINSAMRLNETDLNSIGNIKAHEYRKGGTLVAVVSGNTFAVVQGYDYPKHGSGYIEQYQATCIKIRDLAGLAQAHFGHLIDA